MREGHKEPGLPERIRSASKGASELVGSAIGVQARLNEDGSSFSGNERDFLFLSDGGRQFNDVSALSALDSPADGRSFVTWDYDRDGWIDIAVVNSNAPRLQLYRNDMGRLSAAPGAPKRGMVAFRFAGGNRTAEPTPSWSSRDGYGARVTLDLGDVVVERELKAGEGLAAQNSATLVIGIGTHPGARSVKVRWPSGRVQERGALAEGTLVTVYEDEAQAPGGSAFHEEPYRRAPPAKAKTPPARTPRLLVLPGSGAGPARLRMYSTMATWCEPCRKEAPQLRRLRAAFSEGELALFGVAVDPEDTDALLDAWRAKVQPPYAFVRRLNAAELATVKDTVIAELKQEAVPATLITDAKGRVLAAQWGPPSVSRIRELLASLDAGGGS